jgi:hypothetical protein
MQLLKIVYWKPEDSESGIARPATKDRVEAAKNVVMMDLALLSAEIANALYKKPIAVIAKEIHYEPLPEEMRAVIIAFVEARGIAASGGY